MNISCAITSQMASCMNTRLTLKTTFIRLSVNRNNPQQVSHTMPMLIFISGGVFAGKSSMPYRLA